MTMKQSLGLIKFINFQKKKKKKNILIEMFYLKLLFIYSALKMIFTEISMID